MASIFFRAWEIAHHAEVILSLTLTPVSRKCSWLHQCLGGRAGLSGQLPWNKASDLESQPKSLPAKLCLTPKPPSHSRAWKTWSVSVDCPVQMCEPSKESSFYTKALTTSRLASPSLSLDVTDMETVSGYPRILLINKICLRRKTEIDTNTVFSSLIFAWASAQSRIHFACGDHVSFVCSSLQTSLDTVFPSTPARW